MSDEFQLVIGKKKRKRILGQAPSTSFAEGILNEETAKEGVSKLFPNLSKSLSSASCDDFMKEITIQSVSLLKNFKPEKIVAYGLGNFSLFCNSEYQLQFLQSLVYELKVPDVLISDPAFTEPEVQYLCEKGFKVLPNHSCLYPTLDARTLFFMIHCGTAMFNNVLLSNFQPVSLCNIAILGNSFSEILQIAELNNKVKEEGPLVSALSSFVVETPIHLNCNDQHYAAFSGVALHLFSKQLPPKDDYFWADPRLVNPPPYENNSSIILPE